MIIINDKKVSLIAKLIISYLLLLDFAFLFYVFNTDPGSDQTARGAVFTNLLVWTATLFTPIAAYLFYDSWKEQHNKTVLCEAAKKVYYILHNERVELYELKELLAKRVKIFDSFIALDPTIHEKLKLITETQNNNRNKLGEFTILTEDQTLHTKIEKYRASLKSLIDQKKTWEKEYKKYEDIKTEYNKLIENIKSANYECIQEVKTYIFME